MSNETINYACSWRPLNIVDWVSLGVSYRIVKYRVLFYYLMESAWQSTDATILCCSWPTYDVSLMLLWQLTDSRAGLKTCELSQEAILYCQMILNDWLVDSWAYVPIVCVINVWVSLWPGSIEPKGEIFRTVTRHDGCNLASSLLQADSNQTSCQLHAVKNIRKIFNSDKWFQQQFHSGCQCHETTVSRDANIVNRQSGPKR